MNNIKAFFLVGGLTILLLALGDLIAGHLGFILGAIIAILMILMTCFYADKSLLRIYNAKKLDPNQYPEYYATTRALATKANLPVPQLYLIENESPNAFVVGHKVSEMHLVMTTGLLNLLNPNELTAAIAYEMGHIYHKDVFLGMALAVVCNNITGVADRGMWMDLLGLKDHPRSYLNRYAIMIFGPIAGFLSRITLTPGREFDADLFAYVLCGNSEWLIEALIKIEMAKHKTTFNTVETHPGTAHLFVVNPLRDKKLAKWFTTHPTIEERVARLKLPHPTALPTTQS